MVTLCYLIIIITFLNTHSQVFGFSLQNTNSSELYSKFEIANLTSKYNWTSKYNENTLIDHESSNKQQFRLYVIREDCFDGLINRSSISFDCLTITIYILIYVPSLTYFITEIIILKLNNFICSTISKIVGYFLIVLTMFNKLPQIIKIYNSKSVEGIEPSMIYTDLLMNINRIIYFMHVKLSFSLYGEVVMLSVQNCILILQIWRYNKSISNEFKIKWICLIFSYISVFIFTPGIPEFVWQLLISTVSGLNLISKVPQIIANQNSKSTGQLSFQTFMISFIRTSCRLFTVIKESSDIFVITNIFLSMSQYMIIMLQIMYFTKYNSSKHNVIKKV